MTDHTPAVIAVIALLAAFLLSIAVAKYAVKSNFTRTRLIMSALFIFVAATLTISFGPFARLTLPYALPALLAGIILGQNIGVRAERQKLLEHGIEHYIERFSHINPSDVEKLTWWSIVNFYSIMCGLVLINLIGFTNIILHGSARFVIATSMIGAFFAGTIIPYLIHIWMVPFTHRRHLRRTQSRR